MQGLVRPIRVQASIHSWVVGDTKRSEDDLSAYRYEAGRAVNPKWTFPGRFDITGFGKIDRRGQSNLALSIAVSRIAIQRFFTIK